MSNRRAAGCFATALGDPSTASATRATIPRSPPLVKCSWEQIIMRVLFIRKPYPPHFYAMPVPNEFERILLRLLRWPLCRRELARAAGYHFGVYLGYNAYGT